MGSRVGAYDPPGQQVRVYGRAMVAMAAGIDPGLRLATKLAMASHRSRGDKLWYDARYGRSAAAVTSQTLIPPDDSP